MASIYDELLANDARLKEAAAQIPATSVPVAETAPAPSVYDTLIAQDKAAQAKATEYMLGSLVANNPDKAAREQALAKQNRLPLDVVQRNFDVLDKQDKIKRIQDAVIHSPILRRQLSDPKFAALAHDDTDTLTQIERAIGTGVRYVMGADDKHSIAGDLGAIWHNANAGAAGGFQGLLEQVAPLTDWATEKGQNPVRNLAGWFSRSADYSTQRAQALSPPRESMLGRGIFSGVQSIFHNAPLLAMSLLTRSPNVALTGMAGMAGGSSYHEGREQGLTPMQALPYALSQGTIEFATEKIPASRLLGDVLKNSGAWKTLNRQWLPEITGEQLATVLQDANDWAVLPENQNKPFSEYLKERPSAAAETLIATLVGVGGNVAIMRGIDRAVTTADERARRAEHAQQQADFLQNLNDLVRADKLVARDPDTFEQFIAQASEDGEVQHVYIDAQTLMQSGVAEQIAQVSPAVAAQLPVAARTGGQIAIPIEEYAARIAPTEQAAALLDHLKTEPDGFSRAEAQAYMQEHGAELEAQVEQALAGREADDTFKTSAQTVRDTLKAQLDTAARFTPEVNAAYASMVSNAYSVQAARLGMTPEALFERYPLRVVGEGEGVATLEQSLASQPPEGWKHSTDGGDAAAMWDGTEKAESVFWTELQGKLEKDAPELAGYSHSIGQSAIAHIKGKHGDPKTETPRGQVAITGEDIARIPDIVTSYDAVRTDLSSHQGAPIMVYAKRVDDGILVYLEEVTHKRQNMRGVSLRKYSPTANVQNILEKAVSLGPYARNVVQTSPRSKGNDSMGGQRYDQTAWHGSPHRGIEKEGFKLHKIGTGEGAQAYGWGIYFAEERGTAESYRRELGGSFSVDGKPIFEKGRRVGSTGDTNIDDYLLAKQGDIEAAIAEQTAYLENLDAPDDVLASERQNLTQLQVLRGRVSVDHTGQVYSANIPENRELIDYEKPLSKQPKQVQRAVQAILDDLPPEMRWMADGFNQDTRGAKIYGGLADIAAELDENGVDNKQQAASMLLLKHGVSGLRYLDGSSRSDGKGTHNYVIWDESRLNEDIKTYYQGDPPVATLTGEEIAPRDADIKTLRTAAKAWYETNLRGKKVINQASGREIEFRNARKALNSSANPDKLRLFAALEHVLADGEIKGSRPPRDPAVEGNTKAYHWLEANVSLDGKSVTVGVTVREDLNGNLYYNHNAIEKAPSSTRSDPPHKGGGGIEDSAYDQSIAQNDDVNLQVLEQAPRGQFTPSTNTIALLKNADLSTFLHESGHFFLEMQVDLASRTDAPLAIRQDMQTVFDWFGVRDLPEWHSLDFEEKRVYHEQFARGFEAYLFEGKSPSIEMQGMFQRFRAWLLHVYRDLKALNVELNDQVRSVFDRLLATNEQIALKEQAQSMLPLFESAEQAGLTTDEFAAYQALGTNATQTAIDELQSKGARDMLWMRNTRARVLRELQKQAASRRNEMRMAARRDIMSQPIYRAWQFLTARIEDEDKLAPIAKSKSDPNSVDPTQDNLFAAIAKLGGVNRAQAQKFWGIDPKEDIASPVFGKPVLRAKGGMNLDSMAEALAQDGYLNLDENGKHDLAEFEERFFAALGGSPEYSNYYDYGAAQEMRAGDQLANPESLGAGRLQSDELIGMGLPAEVIDAVKARRMTARQGLHPDLVAELFGFTSGDELVRTLATAPTPSSLIEQTTQQRMLENYGELSTPAALEKAADAAVHNEVRARLVATELNALAKAVGQPKVLSSAARQLAGAIVARQRVRDIKPGQYTKAAAKAAKLAEQWLKKAGRRVVGEVAEVQAKPAPPEAIILSPGFRDWFGERSVEQLEAEYAAQPDTYGGRILDADRVRELSPDYRANRARSAELHPYASALTKVLFARALAKPVAEGREPVVAFLAGGGGSGKSTAGGETIRELNPDIVLDGTLSKLDSARDNIEAALASGRKVAVVYVYRSPEKSARGAVERAIEQGRPVPVTVLADAHAGAAQTIKALAQEYNGHTGVNTKAIWNDGEFGTDKPLDTEDIPYVDRQQAERVFRAEVESTNNAGKLTQELYAAFLGGVVRIGGLDTWDHRGHEQNRPQEPAPDAVASKQTGSKSTNGLAQAASEKRNQLIQHYAARAAHDALAEIEKGIRYLRRFDADGTRKSIDPDYRDQIDALLERFDLRPGQSLKAIDKRASLSRWLESQREQGIDPAIPEWLEAEANREHYKNLTLEQFRGLVDTVKQIEHLGRLKNRLLTDARNRELNAVVQQLHDSIIANAHGRVVDNQQRNTAGSRARHLWRGAMAAHRKFANIVREMDGVQDGGPLWESLVRTMNMAGDKEASMRADAARRLQELSAPVVKQGRTGGTGVFFPTLGISLNRGEILAMALNLGNDGNRQRLLDGRNWEMEQIQPALDTLTTADWMFVQGVWDFFESYRPEIAAKERRVFGVEPQWVDAVPMTVKTRDGQTLSLRGGYYPIRYDTNLSEKAHAHDAAEQAKAQMRAAYTAATTRRSFTKTRAEKVKGQAIDLSFTGIYRGANEVIHDLAWHEWLIDANRLMRRLDAPMRTHYGAQNVQAMHAAIKDVALGDAQASNVLETSLNHLRTGATVAGLGWNLFTALLQPLGMTQSVARVGGVWMARGVREFFGTPTHMLAKVDEVNAQSEFMANRALTMNREINDVRNQLTVGKGKVRTAIEASFFVFIQKAQMTVDYPTWLAAYARAEADPKNRLPNGQPDTARLAALADQAVIDTQGGGQTKDLAQVQRGHPALKLFTNFYSFFSVAFNMVYDASARTNFRNPADVARLAGDYLLILVLPAVLGGVLRQAMKGGDDDDWAEGLLEEQIDYLMGMMVGLREMSAGVKKIAGVGTPFGYQGPAGLRFFAEFDRLAQQINQGEADAALLKSANNVGGILFHYPAGQVQRTVQGAAALFEGRTQNPMALINGYRK